MMNLNDEENCIFHIGMIWKYIVSQGKFFIKNI